MALRFLLEQHGPTLGRPYADRITGSTVHNLKELRPSSRSDEALRILYYFDPRRRALLLVGGDKAGNWNGWYLANIPVAEARIRRHESGLQSPTGDAGGPAQAGPRSRRRRRTR